MSKLSFSLNKPKTTVPAAAPSFKQPTAFSAFDDDEPVDAAPTASSSKESNVLTSKKLKKQMEEEKKVDSTVYEYDEVWDKMQMAKLQQKETKEAESKRKPKYIHDLLSSAATRKLDHLRAEEKMMQRERELEGDEFADKESFGHKHTRTKWRKFARLRRKRKREMNSRKKQGTSTGLAQFYRKLLEDSEQSHEATVAATQKPIIGPQGPLPNMTITKPPDFAPLSDLERARIAREEIIDKRDLLSGGLNLSGTNTRTLKMLSAAWAWANMDNVQVHRAVGTAADGGRTRNEFERRENERRHEKTQRIIAKRNTEEDVESARTRFLERKRRKLEEAHDAGE
ncbi:coiled-coil domain-containing protein 55-domain containing protein [Lentinula guzmanii]|uniref:Coiled-coil domain-containing protein 55-domain containing protein n=1 Tax=Lentinula guzmanii TaxID=2804957 RepID=A0AA38JMC8_9AGAR|nr:coiled-coil domain-containing protein 55-domain containing protein [Lentinula guzmanii]